MPERIDRPSAASRSATVAGACGIVLAMVVSTAAAAPDPAMLNPLAVGPPDSPPSFNYSSLIGHDPWAGAPGPRLDPSTIAQANGWAEGFGWPGVEGTVFAATWFRGELIVGGEFQAIGGTAARLIARWDGVAWRPLGIGLFEADFSRRGLVTDLLVLDDELIVAGGFSHAGGMIVSNIARWNGTSWSAMGAGFDGATQALAVHAGALFAGGQFSNSGSTPTANIARWDGAQWQALAGGGTNGAVFALVSHGDLVAAGQFNEAGGGPASSIARWDGTVWHPLGPGLSGGIAGTVWALQVHAGELIAAGSFANAGALATPGIAAWDGTDWRSLGGISNEVYALAEHGGKLIAGGTFTSAGGVPIQAIARWDGARWSELPSRTGRVEASSEPPTAITLAVRDTTLIVAGRFDMTADALAVNIARWDGHEWWPLGWGLSDHYYLSWVSSFADYGGRLVIGGRLAHRQSSTLSNVDLRAFDGNVMQTLEWRVSAGATPEVTSLLNHKGDLVAAGSFTEIGGVPALGVARWDGAAWHPLGAGVNAPVEALAEFGGDLIVGGHFTAAGGEAAASIARWDGSAWHALGDPLDGPVAGLITHQGELIAGGLFTQAGSVVVNHVAAWNGSSWRPLGTGTDALVRKFAIYRDQLIAAGSFTQAGGTGASRVARWNGSSWTALGAGMDDNVSALAVFGSDLVAGGRFLQAGDVGANHVARWDGSQWSALGTGVVLGLGPFVPNVFALHVAGDRLFVGGHFLTAGGHPSDNIARWDSVRVSDPPPPENNTFAFTPSVPNPFQGTTRFSLSLAAESDARLEILDIRGRRVATLFHGRLPAGPTSFSWDGLDRGGHVVSAGLYFARLVTPGRESTVKVARVP